MEEGIAYANEPRIGTSSEGGALNYACNTVPNDEAKAYDVRSRIYTAYMLCSSVLCVVPIIPYYISKELYRRGRMVGAAISMELFLCLRSVLAIELIFAKILLIAFKKYPTLLQGFFIPHLDLAVLFLASMCTIPLSIISMTWRYYCVYEMVKSTQCGVCHALLEQSYLRDIVYGMPALVSYSGRSGPFFTHENVQRRRIYDGDVAYEVYLYCTSYLLLLPACMALLCNYFYRKRRKAAMSVVRVLSALSHVLLVNIFLVATVAYIAFLQVGSPSLMGLRGDPISIAALVGILSSVAILTGATAFCCYLVRKGACSLDIEVPDNIARSVLKFGILTTAVCNICELFVIREELKDRNTAYPWDKFAYEIFFRVVTSILMLPACFAQLSSELYTVGKRKASAIADRACLFSEILLTNILVLGALFTGVLHIPCFSSVVSNPAYVGFLAALAVSGAIAVIAVIRDVLYITRRSRGEGIGWENVVLYGARIESSVASFGLLNLMAQGTISLILLILGKAESRETNSRIAHANHDIRVGSAAFVHDNADAGVLHSR
ncbi:hypothetical protein AOV_03510 [Anaplasma ovis str. Haibei]|uniref:Uncharacterized protein n=2 Tax=cellular organisms TaxID=131567 RepID=A0A6A6K038_HEVBR|nr:hypothetical protein [Anaplasma ovis]ASI47869.1 hypothetical protein AOV_03510 [Anaplasma ovis str. Haibei]KAF2282027.1 hypothetical protein GH714_042851 [Hevea brasiliensis]